MLVNYRQPCLKKWEVGKSLLSFSRPNPSIFGCRKARTLNLSQARWSSTLFNRCNWVWKRSSYYSSHKKKNGDRCRSKASAWPKRVSWRSSNNHHSVVSSLILANKTSTFRWKNDLSNDAFEYAVQQKLTKLWLFKAVCTKRSASLEWSCLDRREEKVTGGINIANGLELHEVTGASSCRREKALKSRHDDWSSKGEPSSEATLALETRDHLPCNRYRLLVSLPNNRLLRS